MKKILTLSFALSLCLSGSADTIKTFSAGTGVPGRDFPDFMGLGISPDGRYICGASEYGYAIFVADTETGEFKWQMIQDDNGGELRNVNNNGLAIGVADDGFTYSFTDPVEKIIKAPTGYKYVLGNDLTNDGSIWCGSLVGGSKGSVPVISKDNGGEWNPLPMPSADEINLLGVGAGADARYISADGKVILGHLGSFMMPVVWVMNDAGEYVPDIFPAKFMKLTTADLNDDSKPLLGTSAFYQCMSNNGRYVATRGQIHDKELDQDIVVPIVYDTQTKELTVYEGIQPMDDYALGLFPIAICNDGTFVGTVGQPYFDSHGTYIMRAGSKVAELWVDTFPAFKEKLGTAESYGFNVPSGMSADGRYILGYTYYCENYLDSGADAYYLTYVIDTQGKSAIDDIKAETSDAEPVEIYNISGQRLRNISTGINIVRMSDGSVRKIIKK